MKIETELIMNNDEVVSENNTETMIYVVRYQVCTYIHGLLIPLFLLTKKSLYLTQVPSSWFIGIPSNTLGNK
jgi:hypothetical protein